MAIALIATLNINMTSTSNGITLENIEALAIGEGGSSSKTCYWNYVYVGGTQSIRTCSSSGWCIGYEGYQATSTKTGTCIN